MKRKKKHDNKDTEKSIINIVDKYIDPDIFPKKKKGMQKDQKNACFKYVEPEVNDTLKNEYKKNNEGKSNTKKSLTSQLIQNQSDLFNDTKKRKKSHEREIENKRVTELDSEIDGNFSKDKFKRSNLLPNDLSRSTKRKRGECTMDKSYTEEILHKSKKLKQNQSKNEGKINEEMIEEDEHGNTSFEDRITNASFKKTEEMHIKSENIITSDRDSPFDSLFDKLIKKREKIFDEDEGTENHQSIDRVNEIYTELEERFQNGDKQGKKTETNCTENNKVAGMVEMKNRKASLKKTKVEEAIKQYIAHNTDRHANKFGSHKNRKTDLSTEESRDEIEDIRGYVNGIKLSTLQLEALEGLVVILPFEPHPVHMIETKLTNRPKPDQRQQMEALGFELETRCYNSWEDQVIRNNWTEFCEGHVLDEDPGPFLVPNIHFPHKEKTKFVQYLARGLENRTLASVYKRFRLLFTKHFKKGKFTAEEDRIIFDCIDKIELEGYTKKEVKVFAYLSTILKRDRLQIEKHYISLCRESHSKLKYKDCDKLIKTLLKILRKEHVEELKDCKITFADWKVMETLMDHPYNLLRSFWRNTVYPKLFHEGDRDLFIIRRDITYMLQEDRSCNWKLVYWEGIAEGFTGQTGQALYRLFKNLVYMKVPKSMWDDLYACITYLTENYFNKTPKESLTSGILKQISLDTDGIYKVHKELKKIKYK